MAALILAVAIAQIAHRPAAAAAGQTGSEPRSSCLEITEVSLHGGPLIDQPAIMGAGTVLRGRVRNVCGDPVKNPRIVIQADTVSGLQPPDTVQLNDLGIGEAALFEKTWGSPVTSYHVGGR